MPAQSFRNFVAGKSRINFPCPFGFQDLFHFLTQNVSKRYVAVSVKAAGNNGPVHEYCYLFPQAKAKPGISVIRPGCIGPGKTLCFIQEYVFT
jgi:hypothetical protein